MNSKMYQRELEVNFTELIKSLKVLGYKTPVYGYTDLISNANTSCYLFLQQTSEFQYGAGNKSSS